MTITINSQPVNFDSNALTIKQVLEERNIPVNGTAIALHGRLCKATDWETTYLNDGDALTIISAAFGG